MTEKRPSTTQPEAAPSGAGVGGGVPRRPVEAAGGEVGGLRGRAGGGAGDDRGDRPDGPDPEVAAAAREGNPTEGTGANPWPAGGDRTATTASELMDDPDPSAGG